MNAPVSGSGTLVPGWARRLEAVLEKPWLPWAFVVFGVALRLVRYLSHRALEVSEAELALNVLPRSLAQALDPLQYDQAAPPGFVGLLILAKDLFGPGELALRAFPLAASIAALPLFVWLARRMLRPAGVAIATLLLAISPTLIDYGSSAKQYTTDAFFSVLLLLLAAFVTERRRGAVLAYAVVGAASIWLSHSAAFVLAGTGSVLAGLALTSRDHRALLRLVPCGVAFAASFAIFFFWGSDRSTTHNAFLLRYWEGAFMPLPPRSLADLRWFLDHGVGVLESPGAFFPAGAAAFALLAGIVALWREKRDAALLLLSPLPFLLAASALRLYPVRGRLVLFLVPILTLLVGAGADALRRQTERMPLVGVLLLLLLVFDPLASESKKLLSPPPAEDPRPILAHLRDESRPDDALYVYYDAQFAWRYYAPEYGLDPERATIGTSAESVWLEDLGDVERLRGKPRVWVLFTHVHLRESARTEEDFFLFQLDRVGRRLDERHAHGASLYLYDLHGKSGPG
jgi:4-amino-4-deoxy-L-arabinose transferase-like glycosyltransferase